MSDRWPDISNYRIASLIIRESIYQYNGRKGILDSFCCIYKMRFLWFYVFVPYVVMIIHFFKEDFSFISISVNEIFIKNLLTNRTMDFKVYLEHFSKPLLLFCDNFNVIFKKTRMKTSISSNAFCSITDRQTDKIFTE